MAKKKSHHRGHHSRALAVRTIKPIVIRAPSPIKHHRKHGRRRGGGMFGASLGGLMNKERVGIVMGAAAVGMLEASGFIEKLPAVPIIGRLGTTGLVAYLLSNGGRNRLFDQIATSAFVLAAHEYATTGKVVGGDEVQGVDYVAGW